MSKKKRKDSKWLPPEDAVSYFYASSDDDFKSKHPVGYFFLVLLGLTALLMPCILYSFYVYIIIGSESGWILLGWVGGFLIGIGLFNFVAIIIKQYLGHWVSIISFLFGFLLVFISLLLI